VILKPFVASSLAGGEVGAFTIRPVLIYTRRMATLRSSDLQRATHHMVSVSPWPTVSERIYAGLIRE
jgi:hypothetical protein